MVLNTTMLLTYADRRHGTNTTVRAHGAEHSRGSNTSSRRLWWNVILHPLFYYCLFSRQGAEAPAAGILEFRPPGCPPAGSPQVPANGHTAVVALRGGSRMSGVGSIGIVPIGHVAY